MAQYTIYPEQEFMRHREAYNANRGKKAVYAQGDQISQQAST
jgi:hypothetical protein